METACGGVSARALKSTPRVGRLMGAVRPLVTRWRECSNLNQPVHCTFRRQGRYQIRRGTLREPRLGMGADGRRGRDLAGKWGWCGHLGGRRECVRAVIGHDFGTKPWSVPFLEILFIVCVYSRFKYTRGMEYLANSGPHDGGALSYDPRRVYKDGQPKWYRQGSFRTSRLTRHPREYCYGYLTRGISICMAVLDVMS